MKDRKQQILELEKRIRAERNELDSLVEFYELGEDDPLMRNKLKYLQAELEYVNNQFRILNESSGKDSIKALHFEVNNPNEETKAMAERKVSAGSLNISESAVKEPERIIKPEEQNVRINDERNVQNKHSDDKTMLKMALDDSARPMRIWVRKEDETLKSILDETAKEDTVSEEIISGKNEKSSFDNVNASIENADISDNNENISFENGNISGINENVLSDNENVSKEKEIKSVSRNRAVEPVQTIKREAVPVRSKSSDTVYSTVRSNESVHPALKSSDERGDKQTVSEIIPSAENAFNEAEAEVKDILQAAISAENTEAAKTTETAAKDSLQSSVAEAVKEDIKAADSVTKSEKTAETAADISNLEKQDISKQKNIDDFEVEDTVEIKSIPESVKKEPKKKASIENRIGLMVMPILAATLIFISVVLFANALPKEVGNILKQITMFVAGLSFIGSGLLLIKKKIGGAFGQVLMSIGVGEIFVSVVLCRFVFNSISDLWLFIMLFIWSALLVLLKRFGNNLVHCIGEIGVFISVVFGVSYVLANGNHNGIYVIFMFYLLSAFVYYLLFRIKGNLGNLVIFHVFNSVKVMVVFAGVLFGLKNGAVTIEIGSLICAFVTFLSFMDLIIANKKDNSDKDIFCGIANTYYALAAFITTFFGMAFMVMNSLGQRNFNSVNDVITAMTGHVDLRYIPLGAACAIVFVMLIITELAWSRAFSGIFAEIMLALLMLTGMISSHETFKFGFVIAIVTFTFLGYLRNNHILKITALVFYVLYAFLPGEDILRIAVGIGIGAVVLALLYTVKEQYLLAYKLCIYFSLILYAFMVSFSVFDTTSNIGARETAIISVMTVLNLMMIFSPLSKDRKKEFDFIVIPEIANILTTAAAFITAFVIVKLNGTIGYLPLLIGVILTVVSLITGFVRDRLLCRINAIAAMVMGLVVLTAFNYSAFWFAALTIVLGLVLIYLKDEWYSFIYKLIFYLIALGYTVTCTGYFFTSIDNTLAFGPINIVLISMTLITLLFKFTPLSFSRKIKGNDFEITTFIADFILAAASLALIILENGSGNIAKIVIFTGLTLIFIIEGFIKNNKLEKIAGLVMIGMMIFKSDNFESAVYLSIALALVILYTVMLYVFKDSYVSAYKYCVYGIIIVNCVIIPILFNNTLEKIPYVHTEGIILIALLAAGFIFKFTGLAKHAQTKENDQWLFTFITECIQVAFAAVLIFMFKEEGNYLPGLVLAIVASNWITHGFIKEKTLEKIAVICEGYLLLCISAGFIPSFYTIIAFGICIMFVLFMYNTDNAYSLIYKYFIYFLMASNCIVCPVLFRDELKNIPYLGVFGTILTALFVLVMLFRFTKLSRSADGETKDFRICTFASEISILLSSILVMYDYREEGNYVAVGIFAVIMFVWLIHGFAREDIMEKIATIAGIVVMMFVSVLIHPIIYTILAVFLLALYLFFLYRVENSYIFAIKAILYALTLINCIIIPPLFLLEYPDMGWQTALNIIFASLAAVNALFSFTPLCKNPETDERDFRITTIAADNVLIITGIIVTACIETPYDIVSGILTLILVPMGSVWLWREEEEGTAVSVGKYIAVVEYVFVPFILCYTLSAPVYVSSIVAIILSVGCIVLGFVKKMTGVRIYGLVTAMVMIFKLSLVDFEKTSVLAYALSFFIAGISCLIISMLYYFVNAAMKKEYGSN